MITKKAQQFGGALLVIALIISVFAVGLYTGDNDKVTGAAIGLEKITGMAEHEDDELTGSDLTLSEKTAEIALRAAYYGAVGADEALDETQKAAIAAYDFTVEVTTEAANAQTDNLLSIIPPIPDTVDRTTLEIPGKEDPGPFYSLFLWAAGKSEEAVETQVSDDDSTIDFLVGIAGDAYSSTFGGPEPVEEESGATTSSGDGQTVEYVWIHKDGEGDLIREEGNDVPPPPNLGYTYQKITRDSGAVIGLINYDQEGKEIVPKSSTTIVSLQSPPVLDPDNPNQFIIDMEAWTKSVEEAAEKEALKADVERLNKAAESWRKNPTSETAEENFKKEAIRFQFSQDDSQLILALESEVELTREVAEEIVLEQVKDGNTELMDQLKETTEGRDIIFAAGGDSDVQGYIKNNDLEDEYQFYQQRKRTCGKCLYNEEEKVWIDSEGQKYKAKPKIDGTLVFEKITDDDQVSTSSLDQSQDLFTDIKLRLAGEDTESQYYDIIKSEGVIIARDPISGEFFEFIIDGEGNYKIGNTIEPNSFETVDQKFTKFEGYRTEESGKAVYKDSKEKLYTSSDLNAPIEKEKKLIFSESVGEGSDKIELQKVLEMGDNGKVTTTVASAQVKTSDGFKDIDESTYNAIKATKGEGIEEPDYDANLKTLTIKIGDITTSFVEYSTVDGKTEGLKRTIKEESVFKDKNGRVYSSKEVENMDEDKKKELVIKKEEKLVIVADRGEVFKNGVVVFTLTTYYSAYEGRQIAETLRQDTKTRTVTYYYAERDGQSVEVVLNADGTPNTAAMGGAVVIEYTNVNKLFEETKSTCLTGNCDAASLGRSNTRQNQQSSRFFFAQLESTLTDFSGLGYYATFFFSDEELEEWRETVDQTFADLYLGTEYWESAICSEHVDRDQQGVAYIDTKSSLAAVAAHIEATRQQRALVLPDDTREAGFSDIDFLYKITFNVKNGDYDSDPKALEEMKFNIFLKGERTAKLFREDIILEKGGVFGKTGQQAIVQFSDFFYDKICIQFDDVPSSWTLDDDELCNSIIGTADEAEPLAKSEQQQSQQTGDGEVLDI